MTKLKEIAQAIEIAASPFEAYDDIISRPGTSLALAVGALHALREPSQAQYEALSDLGLMWRELNSTIVWQTYIDAILQEKPGP